MNYVSGMYFKSEAEANEWLPFDCDPEEVESYAYAYPDRHAEWEKWRSEAEWL